MLSVRSIRQEPIRLSLRHDEGTSTSRSSIGSRRNPQSTAAILDAAAMLLRQTGPAGLTIDAVARLARCGKPTVYRWWPDKLALLLDLHDAECDRVTFSTEELPRFWDRQTAGAVLRAAFAEAMQTQDHLARFRQRVLSRYGAASRSVLADWLMGDASQDPPVESDRQTGTSVSVRHADEWVD